MAFCPSGGDTWPVLAACNSSEQGCKRSVGYITPPLLFYFKLQGLQQNSLQKSKGGRKRLNSQAAENVEKRRSVNLNKCEMQVHNFPFFTAILLRIMDMSETYVVLLGRQISH